jgi:hypothetical protein
METTSIGVSEAQIEVKPTTSLKRIVQLSNVYERRETTTVACSLLIVSLSIRLVSSLNNDMRTTFISPRTDSLLSLRFAVDRQSS